MRSAQNKAASHVKKKRGSWVPIIGHVALIIFISMPLIIKASEKISLPLNSQISRADIYVEPCHGLAAGTLVLCPGMNGNGQDLLDNPLWSSFAQKEKLNLVGLSFASNDNPQGRGYFNISSGSGQKLMDGLRQAFGSRQPPILIYGFSRGAQFTYGFSRWKPELVIAWCAYSATEWETPDSSQNNSKGIIACGDEDESNYSFSMLQFLKGRALSMPWTWVSLPHMGHAWSPALDEFVRNYFASVLGAPGNKGLWLDVDTKAALSVDELQEHPTLAAWLPDENVAQKWKRIHQP